MMKERTHVKNVGALQDTGIVELQPLTVLIGNSASGKSTLMKLAVLMRYIFKKICIRSSTVVVYRLRASDAVPDRGSTLHINTQAVTLANLPEPQGNGDSED